MNEDNSIVSPATLLVNIYNQIGSGIESPHSIKSQDFNHWSIEPHYNLNQTFLVQEPIQDQSQELEYSPEFCKDYDFIFKPETQSKKRKKGSKKVKQSKNVIKTVEQPLQESFISKYNPDHLLRVATVIANNSVKDLEEGEDDEPNVEFALNELVKMIEFNCIPDDVCEIMLKEF